MHSPSPRSSLAVFPSALQSPHRLGLTLLAALTAVALAGCGPSTAQGTGPGGAPPPPEVSFITVQPKILPIQLEYVGQAVGSRETEVRARVAGILQKRLYEEGATVTAGMPLFQIDPATFQNQDASAQANVAVAEARLSQARREYTRLAPLIAEKAISQKEYDDSKSAVETAQASLQLAQAQGNEAKLNLGYTKVVAPIGGVTGMAAKSEGSLVSGADSLLTTIVQTDPMFVGFSVSESDLLRLNKQLASGELTVPGKRAKNGSLGFDVTLRLADGSVHPQTGKLNFASEKINPQTGSFDARATVPNGDGSLRPGQFVRVELKGASRPNAISVPQRAVVDSPFGKIVFVIGAEDKLAPRPVELEAWTGGDWIVTKGLQSGDRVLVEGFIKAHTPGMVVKPVPYVAAAPGAKPAAAPASAAK